MTVEVGLGVVLLDIKPVVPSEKLPVQVSQVVAGQVFPMGGEFDREPHIRAAVQPVQKTLDDRARDQLKVIEVGQEQGIDIFVQQVGGGCRLLPASAAFLQAHEPRDPFTGSETRMVARGAAHGVALSIGFRSPGYFAGTISINLRIRPSASMPSDRAWKFKTRRWRSTGKATDRTSAKST